MQMEKAPQTLMYSKLVMPSQVGRLNEATLGLLVLAGSDRDAGYQQ